MRYLLPLSVLLSSVATVRAQDEDFFWSYPPDNYTDLYGYEAIFDICGSSCENCREGAKQCHSELWSNICYEPSTGETCCKDQEGTACVDGYYCAWNTTNVAFCCADGTNVEDCGAIFDQTLVIDEPTPLPTTVVVTQTQIRTPTASATAMPTKAQQYTARPDIPGAPAHNNNNGTASDDGTSVGVKVGASIGAFVGAALIAGVAAFFIIRRRKRNASYAHIGGPGQQPGQHFPPAVPTAYHSPALSHATHAAPGVGAFEPMRGAEHLPTEYHFQEYKQPYMASPQPSAAMPYQNRAPAPQQHGVELSEMPGHSLEVHELGGLDHPRK